MGPIPDIESGVESDWTKLSRAGWICRSKEFGTVSAVNNKIIMKITNRYNMELGRGWPYR